MPTDTVFVIAALLVAFTAFAVALAWADIHTHKGRAPEAK